MLTECQDMGDRLLRAAALRHLGRRGWRGKQRLHGVLHPLSLFRTCYLLAGVSLRVTLCHSLIARSAETHVVAHERRETRLSRARAR